MHIANCIKKIKSIAHTKKNTTMATVEVKNSCYNSIKITKKYTF